jgi:hypothetical protein
MRLVHHEYSREFDLAKVGTSDDRLVQVGKESFRPDGWIPGDDILWDPWMLQTVADSWVDFELLWNFEVRECK